MPARNAARTIHLALESVLAQTFQDFEIIVVDDGSTDHTANMVEAIRGRVLLVRTGRRGAAAARNRGAELSRGEYLFFCDADVILAPTLLEKLMNVARRMPNISYVYPAFEWGARVFGRQAFDPEELRSMNYITTMSLIRRAHFPGFDASLVRFQDWDLWLTMLESGRSGVCVPEVLFSVLPGASALSNRGYLSRIRAIRIIRKKHRLPMTRHDYLLAVKEGLHAVWIFQSSF